MDVVFWLPAINPYWHDRFNALHAAGDVKFTCWFNSYLDPARSWLVDREEMAYPHHFIEGSRQERIRQTARLYRDLKPTRIFTFHYDPALWPVWLHRLQGGHVALYALMTWDSWVKRARMKELAKRIFFSASSSVLTPGPDSDQWVKAYGARHVFRLHHAIDAHGLAAAGSTRREDSQLRLLYVGRFVPEKGIPFLQDLADSQGLRELRLNWTFIGSGPLQPQLEAWAATRPNVAVSGFVPSRELPARYARADVLLFPTEGDPYGLVVDEALGSGMAVISSDHAGDIGWRLAAGRGIVCPVGDKPAWTEAITTYAEDRSMVAAASERALEYSAGHDVHRWVNEIRRWIAATERTARPIWRRARGRSS